MQSIVFHTFYQANSSAVVGPDELTPRAGSWPAGRSLVTPGIDDGIAPIKKKKKRTQGF